jgi:hypothetical protein
MPTTNQKPTHSTHETCLHRRRCRSFRRFLLPERTCSQPAGLRGSFQVIFRRFRQQSAPGTHTFPKPSDLVTMIRIVTALVLSSFALLGASCCCTSDAAAPALRPLPQFKEIQPEVHYSK